MNLKKMLLLASMALAAIAFAAPAAAQAQTHGLTDEEQWLAKGALVTLTSANLKTVTSAGTMECGKVTLHYHVDANTDTHVELDPTPKATENATTENCVLTTSGGSKHTVHISNAGTHKVTFNTWGTGTAESTFSSKITAGFITINCTFAGKVHLQGTTTTDILHIGPTVLTETTNNFGCPDNGTMSGEGTAETPDFTPVVSHFKAT